MTQLYNILLQMAPILVAGGILWMAKTLHSLLVTVSNMALVITQIKADLDGIKTSYMEKAAFDQAITRVDGEHRELKTAFWALHDEHISCHSCRQVIPS